ncbi:hypothetical protein EYZ11_009109 [Aspergillus tanneri]|uniref:Uncharacterized protein n=1 Tax=Aspergillus tanneri TaxID=1220188 RepID=A0A4S3J951_9EURO|nr:hypothetical protein EYZ11_009109 [Aspergillus tanneri]
MCGIHASKSYLRPGNIPILTEPQLPQAEINMSGISLPVYYPCCRHED